MKIKPNKYPKCYVFNWDEEASHWSERTSDWKKGEPYRDYCVWLDLACEEHCEIMLNKKKTKIVSFKTLYKINRKRYEEGAA